MAIGLANTNELVNRRPTTRFRVMRRPRWLCVRARDREWGATLLRRIPEERDRSRNTQCHTPTWHTPTFNTPYGSTRACAHVDLLTQNPLMLRKPEISCQGVSRPKSSD